MNFSKCESATFLRRSAFGIAIFFCAICGQIAAQEDPYFVTDHHHLPDPGALAIDNYSVVGVPKVGNGFLGNQLEFEYRIKTWWAAEVQLKGQTTWSDSTVFTGYTFVNKFKLVPKNHWMNAVLTVGWEDANAADRAVVEIAGHAARDDFAVPNGVERKIQEHEIESKLILSRDHKGWNFAGNIITLKDLAGAPWEFGYMIGASRPLSASETEEKCTFCRRRMAAGLELYGGAGDSHSFGFQQTSHYLGPDFSWQLSERLSVKVGPHFGLTRDSQHALVHFAVVYDLPDFGKRMQDLFRPK